MRLIKVVLLFFLVSCLPLMATYLIFEDFLRIGLIGGFILSYSVLFVFADKFLLFFLGAREIIDADNHSFFRVIKSSVFNAYESVPKVYLYSGKQAKAFVFDSGRNWSIAIERKLLESLSNDERKALVNFLIENKRSGRAWFQTKCMGVIGGILKTNIWLVLTLFQWIGNKKLTSCLIIISLMFVKPIIEVINLLNYSGKIYKCPPGLKSIYFQSLEDDKLVNFDYFLSLQLSEELNQEEIIKNYLESFPVFERCIFDSELV